MVEEIRISEASVNFYETKLFKNLEDSDVHIQRSEKLTSDFVISILVRSLQESSVDLDKWRRLERLSFGTFKYHLFRQTAENVAVHVTW